MQWIWRAMWTPQSTPRARHWIQAIKITISSFLGTLFTMFDASRKKTEIEELIWTKQTMGKMNSNNSLSVFLFWSSWIKHVKTIHHWTAVVKMLLSCCNSKHSNLFSPSARHILRHNLRVVAVYLGVITTKYEITLCSKF